jgi:hypothetical protein
MGWYINYEIGFENHLEWDDAEVKKGLAEIDCYFIYLRNYEKPVAIFSLYMKHDIKEIANPLTYFFNTEVKYRLYGTDKWTTYKKR